MSRYWYQVIARDDWLAEGPKEKQAPGEAHLQQAAQFCAWSRSRGAAALLLLLLLTAKQITSLFPKESLVRHSFENCHLTNV